MFRARNISGSVRASPTAPIARVAAEAAGTAALRELSDTLERARETGRMVLDLPFDAIAPDHLARDRIPAEDAEMATLRESIRTHGQRTPVEVTPLTGALPYGLISGWRRLQALKSLHAETGDARFATVQALVRRPETAQDAYVTMVEENEIRLGLSQYERARVAALATQRGVFESERGGAPRPLFHRQPPPSARGSGLPQDLPRARRHPALPRGPPRAPRPRPARAPPRRDGAASQLPSRRPLPTPPRPSSAPRPPGAAAGCTRPRRPSPRDRPRRHPE